MSDDRNNVDEFDQLIQSAEWSPNAGVVRLDYRWSEGRPVPAEVEQATIILQNTADFMAGMAGFVLAEPFDAMFRCEGGEWTFSMSVDRRVNPRSQPD